jgi:diguanylate cyclase (GGDEF)-like protein/PAS domain S-box-containing protein
MPMADSIPDQRDFARVRTRFVAGSAWSFFLAPCAGYSAAVLFGMTDSMHPGSGILDTLLVLLLATLLTGGAVFHFWHFFQPVFQWLSQHARLGTAPARIHRRLQRFTLDYWAIHLIYVLVSPMIFYANGMLEGIGLTNPAAPLHFALLQLVASMLIGLPGFLMGLNMMGRLVAFLGMDKVQVSLRYKLLMLVGFVPLLTSGVLAQYYWWRTGFMSFETTVVLATLGMVTLSMALLSIRGMAQALQPVRDLLEQGESGISHEDISKIRPQSVTEIGYLTQMLARLFRRLGDQDAQVRAIIDNAAEGIIVVDDVGRISTFNRAAEDLFGYQAAEVRGRPVAWLLPSIVNETGAPDAVKNEREVEGVHNRGQRIPMAVRVSEMELSGKNMFTLLVGDISQRKAAAQKLMHAEKRYRHLVETAHDLVWSMDLQARWTYLNKATKFIYGYEPHEMVGRAVKEFQHNDYTEQDFAAFKEILKGKELVQYETMHTDRNGNLHHLSFNAKAYRDSGGRIIGISGTARDITEQKAFERQLAYQAQHDSLTGLANRRQFQQELERLVARVARSGATCALFYIDLDQFKYINDTLGHAAGDRLLVEFSSQLKNHLREGDLLSRFGGDEFTVLLYNVDHGAAMRVAENLRQMVEDYRFLEDGNVYNVSCSIGVAMIDNTAQSVDECMAHADLACHLAKNQGRNRCYMYNPEDQDKVGMEADMGWAARVKDMLEKDSMQMVYQPIASVADGDVQDYEVLVRMLCDDGQIIMPGGFMPAAERFGLIHSVDRWMVRRAIDTLGQMHRAGNQVRFAINLSGRAFEDKSLLPLIQERLESSRVNPKYLTFEITETAAIGNLNAAVEFIGALKEMGCQFALDDFGSGFSSFTYLKHLPVDKLKIDGSFVQNMAQSPVDQAMVRSMAQVAHALGKITIAEFVENEETLQLLQEFGVDYAQGYHVGRPMLSIGDRDADNAMTDPMPPAAMLQ